MTKTSAASSKRHQYASPVPSAEEIAALERTAREANKALGRIEDAKRAIENADLVGRCFKYRNSYSVPEKPSDYWWLYLRVLRMERDGSLICRTFQTDKYGNISIKLDGDFHWNLSGGYLHCSEREYDAAWTRLLKKVNGFGEDQS